MCFILRNIRFLGSRMLRELCVLAYIIGMCEFHTSKRDVNSGADYRSSQFFVSLGRQTVGLPVFQAVLL